MTRCEAGVQDDPVILHGGDLDAARRLFPDAPEPWLDLSTGINPVPYPCPPFEASALHRLPSARDLERLKEAAAAAYGAPGPDCVAAAPGTQILIETLPRLTPRGRVAVLGPTYAEHAAAWARAGHTVETVGTLPSAGGYDVVVAVDPNNPDGRVIEPASLFDFAGASSRTGALLVVDRAFADLEGTEGGVRPERLLAAEDAGRGLVILRSFGKTYGLAGLRLGFALARPARSAALARALGPWAVSGPALAAGLAALPDQAWRGVAAAERARDAARLDRLIRRAGGTPVGGTVLFRTADFADAPGLYRRLGAAGIHVRRFPEAPARLRFGLPADRNAWCRLARILRAPDRP